MSTPDSSETNDPHTYDGPDSDIAAGNITDADFLTDSAGITASDEETDADDNA
ncbi:hypothetical protein [Microbacterium sp. NPDC090003]|uniref:hypothetical protein n=1 Tax=Microbacterium sp. NPDC090003 TaxID=3364203 RepID=UPI00382B38A2